MNATTRHRRNGLSLVELIVVLGIIALLAAMILPAVQMAREAARRCQCQNNLKQVGVALHNYQDVFGVLPVNLGPWPPAGSRRWGQLNGKGWIVSVLPQLEHQPLFDEFEPCFQGHFIRGHGLRNPVCLTLMRKQLDVLQCPSDGSVRRLSTTQFQWATTEVALTSYKGVMGDSKVGAHLSVHPGSLPDCHRVGGCNGLFFRVSYRQPQRLANVLDGLSHTFLVGEDVPEHNDHSAAFYSNTDYASCHAPLNYFPKPPTPRDWPNVMSFRSRHPGGAHFCMADASVHFVQEDIDHGLYRALSTKASGEAVELP